MAHFDLAGYLAAAQATVNAALDRCVPAADVPPTVLHAAMRHSLFAGGKRIRPVLSLAAGDAVGAEREPLLPFACALELVHTFSLIHDDLPALDNDDLRRGRPTCHKVYGEDMAILAGDALHALAFALLARAEAAPQRVLRTVALLGDACGKMVGGQVDDLLHEGKPIEADLLRSIHARKTGALLRASVLGGAILGGASADQEAAIAAYGAHIGVAFQIVDDILDVTGTDETLGKPAGSDLKHDKATYPRLFGLDRSRTLARESLDAALDALTDFGDDAAPLRALARRIVERHA